MPLSLPLFFSHCCCGPARAYHVDVHRRYRQWLVAADASACCDLRFGFLLTDCATRIPRKGFAVAMRAQQTMHER